jgi:MHS family proline/betaine transporter-like MFS transporter
MLDGASFWLILAIQLLIAVAIALYCAALPAAIAEIFETRTRATYLSVANGTAVAIFGGFAPFIATWLIQRTGSPIAPIYLVIAAAILSLVAILSLRETSGEDLR